MAYDLLGIGSKVEYNVVYGVTSCERLTSTTTAALGEWGDQHELKREKLDAACNRGVPNSAAWAHMRCNAACTQHYRVR